MDEEPLSGIDLEDWELLAVDDNGKDARIGFFEVDEFICSSYPSFLLDSAYETIEKVAGKHYSDGGAFDSGKPEFKDIGVVNPQPPPPPVFLKKIEEDSEFADMKMEEEDYPEPDPEKIENQMEFEDKEGEEIAKTLTFSEFDDRGEDRESKKKAFCDGIGISFWGWRLARISALCSVAAAAAIFAIVLGGRQRFCRQQNQNTNLQLQIYAAAATDEQEIKQVVQHATRLNQPLMRRASISFGGSYDWL